MKLLIIDADFKPVVISAGRVLVMSDDGETPIAAVLEFTKGPPAGYAFATCDDPIKLNLLLSRLGVDKTVVVDSPEPPRFREATI